MSNTLRAKKQTKKSVNNNNNCPLAKISGRNNDIHGLQNIQCYFFRVNTTSKYPNEKINCSSYYSIVESTCYQTLRYLGGLIYFSFGDLCVTGQVTLIKIKFCRKKMKERKTRTSAFTDAVKWN